jgi:hypothetical protein
MLQQQEKSVVIFVQGCGIGLQGWIMAVRRVSVKVQGGGVIIRVQLG